MNEIKIAKNSLRIRKDMQTDWDKAYPDRAGNVPNISFATGYKMPHESKRPMRAAWNRWQPGQADKPNESFAKAYGLAVNRIAGGL